MRDNNNNFAKVEPSPSTARVCPAPLVEFVLSVLTPMRPKASDKRQVTPLRSNWSQQRAA